MNGLSWMIYLVGAVDKINPMFAFITVVSVAVTVVGALGYFVSYMSRQSSMHPIYSYERTLSEKEADARYTPFVNMFLKCVKGGLIAFVAASVIGMLTPTKQTMVLIAASEVTETIINSEAVMKSVGDINDVGSDALELLKDYIYMERMNIKKQVKAVVKDDKETDQ